MHPEQHPGSLHSLGDVRVSLAGGPVRQGARGGAAVMEPTQARVAPHPALCTCLQQTVRDRACASTFARQAQEDRLARTHAVMFPWQWQQRAPRSEYQLSPMALR